MTKQTSEYRMRRIGVTISFCFVGSGEPCVAFETLRFFISNKIKHKIAMKPAVITLILSFISYLSFSQTQDVYKFKATMVRVVTKDKFQEFEEASEKKDVSVFLVLSYKDQKVTVYTPTQQSFDLLKVSTSYTDQEKNSWMVWNALNGDGVQCVIREKIFAVETSDGFNTVFYIDYKNFTYEYAGHRES